MLNLNKYQKIIIIIIGAIVLGIMGYYIYGRNTEELDVTKEDEILIKENETKEKAKGKIVVHITGAVKNEGVVALEENSRITDAVNAAGGLKDDADMSKINLAYILEDGIKINIPSINDKEEVTESEENVDNLIENTNKSESNIPKLVNINKATQTELETLPGIGPSIALKILAYREENGKFDSVEDLKKVSGIGDNKFENIKNLICTK